MRIFISYSSVTRDKVTALADDFESTGHEVWFDHKLRGGQEWWSQILDNIRQCDLFVFALTPQALDSYPCQLEFRYAHQLGKNILPVLIGDDVPIEMLAPELTVIQFVDYRDPDRESAFSLMNALMNLPEMKPLPDPLPTPPEPPISYIGSLNERVTARQLNLEDQAALLITLKQHLDEPDNRPEIIELLKKFQSRQDLFASIDKEIDTLLANIKNEPVKQPVQTDALPRQTPGIRNSITAIISRPVIVAAIGWGVVGLLFGGLHSLVNQISFLSVQGALVVSAALAGGGIGYTIWQALDISVSRFKVPIMWWIVGCGLAAVPTIVYVYENIDLVTLYNYSYLSEDYDTDESLLYLFSDYPDYSDSILLFILPLITIVTILFYYIFVSQKPRKLRKDTRGPGLIQILIYIGIIPLVAAGVAYFVLGYVFDFYTLSSTLHI